MKSDLIAIAMQQYEYNEYLLVLKPNESVRDRIQKIKEELSTKYKVGSAGFSHPQIILVRFFQFKTLEDRIIMRLKTIAEGYPSFNVILTNFGSFPSHTIFINVESKHQPGNLVKQLKGARQIMTLNQENKPHFISDPYLAIAHKLLPWQYEQVWNEYSRRHFSARFIAESMLLIKRSISVTTNGHTTPGKYQTAALFKFMNLPVAARQGELFG